MRDWIKAHNQEVRQTGQGVPFRPEDLGVIQRPVLILHGDRDEFFPVDIPTAMYRAMPAAELCILPCTGHELPPQWPDLFLQLLTGFLQRHAAEGN